MSIFAFAAGAAAVTATAIVAGMWGPAKLGAATRRSSNHDDDTFQPLDLEALVGGPAQRRAPRPVFTVAPEDRGEFPGDRKLAPVARTWDKRLGRYVDVTPRPDAAMEAFVAKQREYLNGGDVATKSRLALLRTNQFSDPAMDAVIVPQRDIDHANFVKGFEQSAGGNQEWRGTGAARFDDAVRRGFVAIALLGSLALSACGSTPTQQASLVAAGTTLAAIAAANNTTVAKVVSQGALFCQSGGAAGVNALTVAVATVAGLPASVTGQTSQAVAQTCGALSMVPVPPPAAPESVPVLVAPTTLPSVGSLTSAPSSQSFYQPDPARGLKA